MPQKVVYKPTVVVILRFLPFCYSTIDISDYRKIDSALRKSFQYKIWYNVTRTFPIEIFHQNSNISKVDIAFHTILFSVFCTKMRELYEDIQLCENTI